MEHKADAREAVLAALSDVVTTIPVDQQQQQQQQQRQAGLGSGSRYVGTSPLNPANANAPLPPAKESHLPEIPPAPPAKKGSSGGGGRLAGAFRRGNSDEKEAKRRAKEERMRDQINKSSAKNSRMDVIDRMDLSGLVGASMFHHDSPYDAVSAHRNKGKRAPVLAFDPNIDPMTGQPWKHGQPQPRASGSSSRTNLSPRAQATLARMDDKDSASIASSSNINVPALGMYDNGASVTGVPVSAAAAAQHPDASTDAERAWRYEQGYHTQPAHVPSARHDVSNPNADVWGVSAEPWQDFAQPKQPGRHGPAAAAAAGSRHSTENRSGLNSSASSVFDMEAIMTGRPGDTSSDAVDARVQQQRKASGGQDDGPKRSKSLIKRIRSVRQAPNVPMGDDPGDVSSGSAGAYGQRGANGSSPRLHRAMTHDAVQSQPQMQTQTQPQRAGDTAVRFDNFARASRQALEESSGSSGSNVKRSGSLFGRFGRNKGRSGIST